MRALRAGVVATVLAAAPADAAVRYASPTGFNGGPCTVDAKCTFNAAIEGAADNDEVVVTAGTYNLAGGAGSSAANLYVHGEQPGAVTVISPSTAVNLFGATNGTVSDMAIRVTSSGTAVFAKTIQRVDAQTAAAAGAAACRGVQILDSVCVNGNGDAIFVDANAPPLVRNVTAFGSGNGIRVLGGSGEVFNTIARGTSGADIYLGAPGVTLSVHHSNFVDSGVFDGSDTLSLGAGNQSQEPAFIGPTDYHQQPGSITVDRGAPADGFDFDGDLRTLGPAPDIGADEAPSAPLAAIAPATNVATTSATFNGQLNTGGLTTSYWFSYTPDGGGTFETVHLTLPARPNTAAVSANVANLQPATSYSVVLHADNGRGQAVTSGERFTTPGAGGPGGGSGGADTEAPILSALSLTRRTFALAANITPLTAAKRGTTLRFRVSEAGSAAIAVQRATTGRRRGSRCVAPRKAKRTAKRCVRYVTLATLRRTVAAGANTIAFSGRVGTGGLTRTLRPGRHRFRVVVTDAAGNRSEPATAAFRIVRR